MRLDLRTLALASLASLVTFGLFTAFGAFDYEYEGHSLTPALWLGQGRAVYGPEVFGQWPWMFSSYGPAYYAATGLGFVVFGPALWFGRLLSLASLLLVWWAMRRVLSRFGSDDAIWIALITLTLNVTVWRYSTLMRVDMFGAACGFLALALVMGSLERDRPAPFVLAGMLSLTAFATKVTLIATAPAIVLLLLSTRRVRPTAAFLAGLLLVGGAFLALLAGTGNLHYLTNAGSQVGDFGVSFVRALGHFREFSGQPLSVLGLLAGGSLAWDCITERNRRPELWAALAYFAAALAIGLVGAGHLGANVNHFMELALAMALCTGLQAQRWLEAGLPRAASATMLALAMGLQIVVFHSNTVRGRVLVPRADGPELKRAVELLRERLPAGSGVLSFRPELPLYAGHVPLFNDVYYYEAGSAEVRRMLREAVAEGKPDALVRRTAGNPPGYVRIHPETGAGPVHVYLHERHLR